MAVTSWPSRRSSRADARPATPPPTTHTFFFFDDDGDTISAAAAADRSACRCTSSEKMLGTCKQKQAHGTYRILCMLM
jgi:hypothetical protein